METHERLVKGIWCPIEIWEAKDISWDEKIILLEVDSFTRNDRDCFISDEYIADMIGKSARTASRYMTNLIEKGYIIRTRFDGRKRFVRSNINTSCGADTPKIAKQVRQNWRSRSDKNGVLLNKDITNNKNTDISNKEIELPFSSDTFKDLWNVLIKQPKWKGKSEDALRMSLRKLGKHSEAEAVAMMEETIANGWQGLFERKATPAVKPAQETYAQSARRVMEALRNGN